MVKPRVRDSDMKEAMKPSRQNPKQNWITPTSSVTEVAISVFNATNAGSSSAAAAAAGLAVVAPLVLESMAMADVVATLLTSSGSFWRMLLSFLWSGLFRETDSFLLLCDHHIALVVKEMTMNIRLIFFLATL